MRIKLLRLKGCAYDDRPDLLNLIMSKMKFCPSTTLYPFPRVFIFIKSANYINQHAKIGCIQEVYQNVKNLQNGMVLYMGAPKINKGTVSTPSKALPSSLSLSLQTIHIKARGTTLHAVHFLPFLIALQQNKSSFTDLGIIQDISNQQNISHHSCVAKLQCSRR